ncbi:MAG: 30S ribosomal protein S6 [Parachlamydiales bacterium]|nr:30S ribosomal protein S6 [Parachlamydiales bacterium]
MKKSDLRLYEGMFILNATLSEQARQKALEKITTGIVDKGGEIHKVHDMGRRKMAYEINKKREGYYYVLFFSVNPKAIANLWEEYKLHEDLIRYTTKTAESIAETLEFKPIKLA